MAGKSCRVCLTDPAGIRHSVEVTAESLYEAAALALKALKWSDWVEAVGPGTRLEIQVMEPTAIHMLYVSQLNAWLNGGAKTPADASLKNRLKNLLAS
jgi:hypothetical protein